MPVQTYEVKDPKDGSIFELQLDHPPTPEEARTAVAKYRVTTAKATGQPMMHAPTGTEPVTLGDFMDNPQEAGLRIAKSIGRDVTDPRFLATLALSVIGPKVLPSMMGKVADVATDARAALSAPAETFISRKLGLDPTAIQLQATRMRLQAAKSRTRQAQIAGRLEAESVGATPPEAVAPNAPSADTPPPPSPSRAPVARATQSAGASAPFDLNSLTPVEQTQGAKWLAEGVPADVVLQRIQSSRQMTGVLKTATPDEAAREVVRMTREAAKRSTRGSESAQASPRGTSLVIQVQKELQVPFSEAKRLADSRSMLISELEKRGASPEFVAQIKSRLRQGPE